MNCCNLYISLTLQAVFSVVDQLAALAASLRLYIHTLLGRLWLSKVGGTIPNMQSCHILQCCQSQFHASIDAPEWIYLSTYYRPHTAIVQFVSTESVHWFISRLATSRLRGGDWN